MEKIHKIIFFHVFMMLLMTSLALAKEAYTPLPGGSERKAILETLREGLKKFPESYRLGFEYKREDVKVMLDKIVFLVDYLKVKEGWAWIEVDVKDYCCSPIYALLNKENDKWKIKGIVNPLYILCSDHQNCIDIKVFIYKKFMEKFPSLPIEVFPEVDPERKAILNSLVRTVGEESLQLAFIVRYFKIKNRWAWIETHPRSLDGWGQFEPIDALLQNEDGKWKVKKLRPCCDECDEDPDCRDIKKYYKKIMREFPSAPRELFPK